MILFTTGVVDMNVKIILILINVYGLKCKNNEKNDNTWRVYGEALLCDVTGTQTVIQWPR